MEKVMTLYPSADTYIDSSFADGNFSKQEFYFLGNFRCSTIYRILLQFHFTSVPQNAKIRKAVLQLYCTRNDTLEQENLFEIHPVLDAWKSEKVNFENQPRWDRQCVLMKAECAVYENICTDVTDIVRIWLRQPETNCGLLIKPAEESSTESLLALASSRQLYQAWKPRLELTLELPEQEQSQTEKKKKVAIVTPQFLEWSGERCIFGGGERYLAELAELLAGIGCQVDVFQPSNGLHWQKQYSSFRVFGVGDGGFDEDFFISLNKSFFELTQNYDLHIYLSMDLTYPFVFENSICVSHGVWWDSTERPWWRSEKWYSRLFAGLDKMDTLVSVDTNTINWLNAVNPRVCCKKIYIPNYADLDIFKPEGTSDREKDTLTILYPRRLVPGRGWSVTKEVAKELLQERSDLKFSFVGRGLEQSEKQMELLAEKNPGIAYRWYRMEDMHQAYQDADIVLIPSCYTEGTSFSLLEAMACGKPIIAGLVGGLTDLVIDGYNGLLIQVSKDTLKSAVLRLADNAELRREMGQHALQIAQSFSKRFWEQRWKKVITEHLQS